MSVFSVGIVEEFEIGLLKLCVYVDLSSKGQSDGLELEGERTEVIVGDSVMKRWRDRVMDCSKAATTM